MEKRKYFVKAHSFKQYKSDVIECTTEEVALAEYKSALEGGHVPQDSEEVEYDVIDITDEEFEEEDNEEQSQVVQSL